LGVSTGGLGLSAGGLGVSTGGLGVSAGGFGVSAGGRGEDEMIGMVTSPGLVTGKVVPETTTAVD
jgi:hypothetical protein